MFIKLRSSILLCIQSLKKTHGLVGSFGPLLTLYDV